MINLVIWIFWGVAIFGVICLVVILTVYIVRARKLNTKILKERSEGLQQSWGAKRFEAVEPGVLEISGPIIVQPLKFKLTKNDSEKYDSEITVAGRLNLTAEHSMTTNMDDSYTGFRT